MVYEFRIDNHLLPLNSDHTDNTTSSFCEALQSSTPLNNSASFQCCAAATARCWLHSIECYSTALLGPRLVLLPFYPGTFLLATGFQFITRSLPLLYFLKHYFIWLVGRCIDDERQKKKKRGIYRKRQKRKRCDFRFVVVRHTNFVC